MRTRVRTGRVPPDMNLPQVCSAGAYPPQSPPRDTSATRGTGPRPTAEHRMNPRRYVVRGPVPRKANSRYQHIARDRPSRYGDTQDELPQVRSAGACPPQSQLAIPPCIARDRPSRYGDTQDELPHRSRYYHIARDRPSRYGGTQDELSQIRSAGACPPQSQIVTPTHRERQALALRRHTGCTPADT